MFYLYLSPCFISAVLSAVVQSTVRGHFDYLLLPGPVVDTLRFCATQESLGLFSFDLGEPSGITHQFTDLI